MAVCALLAGMVWIWLGQRGRIETPVAVADADSTSPV
jgi:DHA1 family bicyclomycin/chloramphenicol resistance-like MFS transporter